MAIPIKGKTQCMICTDNMSDYLNKIDSHCAVPKAVGVRPQNLKRCVKLTQWGGYLYEYIF